jgi:hypothetical protein
MVVYIADCCMHEGVHGMAAASVRSWRVCVRVCLYVRTGTHCNVSTCFVCNSCTDTTSSIASASALIHYTITAVPDMSTVLDATHYPNPNHHCHLHVQLLNHVRFSCVCSMPWQPRSVDEAAAQRSLSGAAAPASSPDFVH